MKFTTWPTQGSHRTSQYLKCGRHQRTRMRAVYPGARVRQPAALQSWRNPWPLNMRHWRCMLLPRQRRAGTPLRQQTGCAAMQSMSVSVSKTAPYRCMKPGYMRSQVCKLQHAGDVLNCDSGTLKTCSCSAAQQSSCHEALLLSAMPPASQPTHLKCLKAHGSHCRAAAAAAQQTQQAAPASLHMPTR
jgi:hypothetical protein